MASAQQGQQDIAIPGQLLGPAGQYAAGPGTHMHGANLHSSLLGRKRIISSSSSSASSAPPSNTPATTTTTSNTTTTGPPRRMHRMQDALASTPNKRTSAPSTTTTTLTLSVERTAGGGDENVTAGGSQRRRRGEVLPEVGDAVLCRVTRIAPRQATVAILAVASGSGSGEGAMAVLEAAWQGVVRAQDVRAAEKDRVRIHESFRPGDIVRARVISLGDQANYYLTTASNELGVIMATSEAGNTMFPVSWKEYRDPETGVGESRKVAKPF